MSLFMKDGKVKSTLLMNAFCLSFLFIAVFVGIYYIGLEAVTAWLPLPGNNLFLLYLPPVLLSIFAALLCCLFFLLPTKKLLTPLAFSFFAVYACLGFILLLSLSEGGVHSSVYELMALFLLPPTFVGNLLSWSMYGLMKKK